MVKTRIWRKARTDVQSLSAQEPFMIWVKAGFFTGMLLASPYIFWQIWSFVAAGLYPHEKRYVYMFLPISLVLFWTGAAMAFFVVFQYVLDFLFQFNRSLDIQTDPRISEWIGFVLILPLGFGIAFQLPLVMFFLNRIGIFSLKAYLEKWRIAVLVIFVISMFLTPADPMSMILMAAPLTAALFPRHRHGQVDAPRAQSVLRRVRSLRRALPATQVAAASCRRAVAACRSHKHAPHALGKSQAETRALGTAKTARSVRALDLSRTWGLRTSDFRGSAVGGC